MNIKELSRSERMDILKKCFIQNMGSYGERFMFFKLFFPRSVSSMILEGSISNFAFQVADWFEKQGMEQQLFDKLVEYKMI